MNPQCQENEIRTPVLRYPKDRGVAQIMQDNITTPTKSSSARIPRKVLVEPEQQPRRRATTDERSTQVNGSSVLASPRQPTRRSSGTSARSRASTIVEAFLVDERPRRQQTLRTCPEAGQPTEFHRPLSSINCGISGFPRLATSEGFGNRGPRMNRGSASTANSASITSFGRDGRRSGEIPVMIIQEQEPPQLQHPQEISLRSVPSMRTGRTISLESIPFDDSVFPDDGEDTEDLGSVDHSIRRPRRRLSQSDPSDIRTIDYPPAVPRRSSSLSAPTSHNASRSNSLTGDGATTRNSAQPRSKYPPLAHSALQSREPAEPAGLLPPLTPPLVMDSGTGKMPIKILPPVREVSLPPLIPKEVSSSVTYVQPH